MAKETRVEENVVAFNADIVDTRPAKSIKNVPNGMNCLAASTIPSSLCWPKNCQAGISVFRAPIETKATST